MAPPSAANQQLLLLFAERCQRPAFHIRRLLDGGADLECKTSLGETPLHLACFYLDISTIDVLLRRGANIYAKDNEGNTPLDHIARNVPVADFFAKQHKAKQKRARSKIFAKHCQLLWYREGNQFLHALLDEMAAPPSSIQQMQGIISRYGIGDVIADVCVGLSLFLEQYPEIARICAGALSENGDLPLHRACFQPDEKGLDPYIKLLIDLEPSVLCIPTRGSLPLHLALQNNLPDHIIEQMVEEAPETVRIANPHTGLLPLHAALRYNASDAIVRLLVAKAPETVHTADEGTGDRPLHMAIRFGCSCETIRFLVERDPGALSAVTRRGNLPCTLIWDGHHFHTLEESSACIETQSSKSQREWDAALGCVILRRRLKKRNHKRKDAQPIDAWIETQKMRFKQQRLSRYQIERLRSVDCIDLDATYLDITTIYMLLRGYPDGWLSVGRSAGACDPPPREAREPRLQRRMSQHPDRNTKGMLPTAETGPTEQQRDELNAISPDFKKNGSNEKKKDGGLFSKMFCGKDGRANKRKLCLK